MKKTTGILFTLIAILLATIYVCIVFATLGSPMQEQSIELLLILGLVPYAVYVITECFITGDIEGQTEKEFISGILINNFWVIGVGLSVYLIGMPFIQFTN